MYEYASMKPPDTAKSAPSRSDAVQESNLADMQRIGAKIMTSTDWTSIAE